MINIHLVIDIPHFLQNRQLGEHYFAMMLFKRCTESIGRPSLMQTFIRLLTHNSGHRTLMVALGLVILLTSHGAPCHAFDEKELPSQNSHRDKTIKIMKTAYEAVTAPKKPYKIRGLYESHRGVDGKATKTYSIPFAATINRDQFRYDFEFAALPPSNTPLYDKIIAMSDGDSLYVSRFTPRINPHGREADIYKSGSLFIPTRSFRADYHNLESFLIPPSIFDELEIETIETGTGDLECTYPLNKITWVRFVLSKKQGFNLVSVEAFVTGENRPRQEQLLSWKTFDGHWYLAEYQDSMYRADQSLSWSYQFKITEFQWADSADLEQTAMSKEDSGSPGRVLDRRKSGDQKIYEFVKKGLDRGEQKD